MNSKAQLELGGMELNPVAILFAFVGALISMVVMKKVEVNIIFKILTPIATFVACYIVTSIQLR